MAPAVPRITSHQNDGPGMIHSTNPINNNNTVKGNGQHRPRNQRAMENFRQFVMKIAEISGADKSPAQMELIERRLADFFSNYHIPNHPPYAAMIQRAMQELNEKGGSSEESISEFIKKEYDDLPWAHSTFLNHHLQTLSECGEIVKTRKCCYLLGSIKPKKENPEETQRSRSGRGSSRGPRGRVHRNVEAVEKNIRKNVVEYGEVNGGYKPFHEERDEMAENENEQENKERMLFEEVNPVFQQSNEVMKEQNDVILDHSEQLNPVMDLYPVPLQPQDPEVSLLVTTKKPEHVMAEQESSSNQVQTELQHEGPLQLGGKYIPSESESTLQTTLIHTSNLDPLDKGEDVKLQHSETDSSGKEKAEMPKLKKAEAPVRRFTRSLLIAKQAAEEHVEDSSGVPMGESTKTELKTKGPQNSGTQGVAAQCGRRRGRPAKQKPDIPVGELTMTDPQNPCTRGELARRGRPSKRKANTPV